MTRANPNRHARLLGTIFAVLLITASGVILLSATASAQQTANETNGTGTQIDTRLTLLESSYNSSSGNATLRFRSDGAHSVTVADAGAFQSDGPVSTKSEVIEGEETMRINVTEYENGAVGVSISTDAVLYAHTVRDGESEAENPLDETSGTAGWLGGASVVVVMSTLAGWRELRKDPTEPRRAT
jgi:hypothetical protein